VAIADKTMSSQTLQKAPNSQRKPFHLPSRGGTVLLKMEDEWRVSGAIKPDARGRQSSVALLGVLQLSCQS
ncbi:hypothetical protein L9F63_001481, partial [Diploptera punctata]